MRYSKTHRDARDIYMHTDKTQTEIADILSIDRKTLYLWIRNGRWEEMKRATRQAPGMILQDIYAHIDAVNDEIFKRAPGDRCPTMQEVEKLRKLIKMSKQIGKHSLGTYLEIFEEMIRFTRRIDLAFCKKFTRIADDFVKATLGDPNKRMNVEMEEMIDDYNASLGKYPDISPTFPTGGNEDTEDPCEANIEVTTEPTHTGELDNWQSRPDAAHPLAPWGRGEQLEYPEHDDQNADLPSGSSEITNGPELPSGYPGLGDAGGIDRSGVNEDNGRSPGDSDNAQRHTTETPQSHHHIGDTSKNEQYSS